MAEIISNLHGASGYAFNSGIGSACRPNDPNGVAWWGQSGTIEREKIDKESKWGYRHICSPPDWASTDLFFNKHPYFRRGRRSPLFNNSAQIAKLLHTGIDENFPTEVTANQDYPGYPFGNKPDNRKLHSWRHDVASLTFRPHDKPLVNRQEDIENYDAQRALAPSMRRARSLPSSNVSYSSACSTVASVSLANSKLAVSPYFYGAIPGSRWYQESKKLMKRFDERRIQEATLKRSSFGNQGTSSCKDSRLGEGSCVGSIPSRTGGASSTPSITSNRSGKLRMIDPATIRVK